MRIFYIFAGVLFAMMVSPAAFADTTEITQADQTFSQEAVTLKAGDTIHFTNKDSVTHNIKVMGADGDVDDKGLQKPGEVITEVFAKPGEYKVRCAIHPKMKMTVKVQ
jgi:plastocyanin